MDPTGRYSSRMVDVFKYNECVRENRTWRLGSFCDREKRMTISMDDPEKTVFFTVGTARIHFGIS